jgi:peptidyl-prolyl cis-trans isomerase C
MTTYLTRTAVAALLAASCISGMAQNIAIVNGKAVPSTRLEAMLRQMERAGRPAPPDAAAQIKDRLVLFEIISQEGQKRGLDATDEFKSQVELLRQNLLVNDVMADFQKTHAPTDAEVQAEYDKFAAANGGKEYKARHILVEKEDEAKKIIAQLKKGGKFEDIAKKSSKDTGSGAKGGELDWAGPASYVKEFSEAMVALAKGKTSEVPVKSQFGFHIIRVDDVRDAQLPKIEEVKPQIVQQLMQQKSSAYIEELRAKARIE